MSKIESNMLPLGTVAANFELPDVTTGQMVRLSDKEKTAATVVMFICNHCPYVKHINPALTQVALSYQPKSIRFIAISSNDINQYPDDSPEHMRLTAASQNYPFPYLYDETQEVAKAYHAACTPDFYIFDSRLILVYRGQFDDSRPGNSTPVTGSSVRDALDAILDNRPITTMQKPSIGCNIKWIE